jgi:energy-coupling factor transport system substrate-specific component
VGLKLALAVAAGALAATPTGFLRSHELAGGGFAESGGSAYPALSAWAVLGLHAVGEDASRATAAYLQAHERELRDATDLELVLSAEAALHVDTSALVRRVRALRRRSGAIGPTLNSTIWGVLSLRAARVPVDPPTRRYLLRHQTADGGWSWGVGITPDSNDTAAALEALRSLGVRGKPIRRGLAYLRRLQNRDGGFELQRGRGSDAQSTAWAIQAFLAAGARPGQGAFRYLAGLRRRDGSFRYSRRYATTPVWVTAQVLPALARRAFPLG